MQTRPRPLQALFLALALALVLASFLPTGKAVALATASTSPDVAAVAGDGGDTVVWIGGAIVLGLLAGFAIAAARRVRDRRG